MFDIKKFNAESRLQVVAINYKITDLRTGEKQICCFYYPNFACKSLEDIRKYGFQIDELGENTKASGSIDLGELFARFTKEGGLE